MVPVQIEIVYPSVIMLGPGCRGCAFFMKELDLGKSYGESCKKEYPPEWLEEAERLSTWIDDAARLYKHRIQVRFIDAHSPLGLWKQIRYGISRLPGFIVDQKEVCVGWDTQRLEALIDQRIRETAPTRP